MQPKPLEQGNGLQHGRVTIIEGQRDRFARKPALLDSIARIP